MTGNEPDLCFTAKYELTAMSDYTPSHESQEAALRELMLRDGAIARERAEARAQVTGHGFVLTADKVSPTRFYTLEERFDPVSNAYPVGRP